MEYFEEILKIYGSCQFRADPYGVTLEYTEYQGDSWYDDTETCYDIDRETAAAIVAFLQKHVLGEKES